MKKYILAIILSLVFVSNVYAVEVTIDIPANIVRAMQINETTLQKEIARLFSQQLYKAKQRIKEDILENKSLTELEEIE